MEALEEDYEEVANDSIKGEREEEGYKGFNKTRLCHSVIS